MAASPHRVGRVDLRASVADFDMALAFRPRIEALAWKLLPGVVERVFDSVAPPDLHVRLARLDLDLGTVRPDHLEEDMLAALERALTEALGEAIHSARVNPSDDARLLSPAATRIEAFETYLATGVVPLAGRGEGFDPAARLHDLIAEQPDALVAMLRRRGRERHLLERLVLQAGEGGLRALLALLAPADAAIILALIADIIVAHRDETVAPLAGLGEPALERLLWVSTLEFLLRDAGTQFNRRRFLAFLLGREARRAGIDYVELLRMLGEAVARIKARMGFRSSLPVVLAELLAESGQAPPVAERAADESDDAAFAAARAGDFTALLALVRRRAGNAAALEALVRRLDAALFAGLIRRIEPAHAEQILAILDDIGSLHRAEALPVLPEAVFEQRLRFLTLRYLLNDAGSQFNRRRFLEHLLQNEARRAGVDYAALLRLLSDAVEQLRARTALRSSMPVVLAELLTELKPVYEPETEPLPEPGTVSAFAAAKVGDFEPLLALLRERVSDAAAFEALADALPAALFESVVRKLAPSRAQAIHEETVALLALHRVSPVAVLSEARFARLLRRLVLADLLGEPGRFDRRAWVRRLLRALAQAASQPEAALRAALARAIDAGGGSAALNDELRAEIEALAVPATSEALIRRAAELGETERQRTIAGLDPVNAAAVEAELAALARLHAAAPLLPLDAARFGALIWALAVDWLREQHGRFDRLALARHLLQGIARHGGKTVDDVTADVQRSLANTGSAGDSAYAQVETLARERGEGSTDETSQRRAVEHFLRTGQPPSAGRGLPALAKRDAIWLAALLRRLARETVSAMPGLIGRLLDWLLPEELLAVLAPESVARAQLWSDSVGGGLAAWQPAFAALLRDETPPFAAAPGGAGKRLDRLALIAHWLDHGSSAWWSGGGAPKALLADLEHMTLAELTWLFLAEDRERSFERLWRAVEPLGRAARMRLIERIAPWATSRGGPLAPLLTGADERRRIEILVRAAAAALEGVRLDLAALATPAPQPKPAPSALPSPDRETKVDRERLFAWLDGAHAGAAETQALLRYFAKLADARDRRLVDYLAPRRANAAAQMRWATVLPPEAIGRVVHLLVPAGARAYLDAAMAIAAAWRQVAPFGARRVDPARIWAMLLAAIAEPGSIDLPRVVERLVQGLTRGNAGQATKLRAQALRLAQDGGHVAVAAALKRLPAPVPVTARQASPPKSEPAKAAPADEEKPVPPDPDHPIFIGNAGLVLFNPYLPALFERLGLITKNEEGLPRIEGVESQSRAVHLLQYIADGRTDAPEPELVLNKLLGGVAVAQPIEASIVATEAEIETCNGLMHAVIANWTIIKNTSIDGLRETFLQREGRLKHGDDRWDLHVQRKGLDVLVDQIPWTFSMIYHRWMADPIHVTW